VVKGGIVIELEGGKMAPLFEGVRNKTNRFKAPKVFTKNKEWLVYIENYFKLIL
jgi:hypothetical protein